MEELDQLVLSEIKLRVLTPDNVDRIVHAASKKAERGRKNPREAQKLETAVRELKAEHAGSVLERITDLEKRIEAKERLGAELKVPTVTDLADLALHKHLRENLDRFRELLTGRHTPKARQVLRKLLGQKNVLWFAVIGDGSYRVSGETRIGPLFDGIPASEVCGAQERT